MQHPSKNDDTNINLFSSNFVPLITCVFSLHFSISSVCLRFQQFRPNEKKISVFRVTGLNILGRVGTHIFFKYFFSGKNILFMHFERHFAFQNA